ncbi:MAG: phosphodiesterase [Anaerovoracaceae bacterium]
MKIMIASDIHGSAHYCRRMLGAFDREDADRLLLLGDILYHGPRNDLPEGYAPKEVIAMLNERKSQIFCVRGNCDTEVDQMVLEFPILADYCILTLDAVKSSGRYGEGDPADKYDTDDPADAGRAQGDKPDADDPAGTDQEQTDASQRIGGHGHSRLIYATHGHRFNIDNQPPLSDGDILLQGHTHIPSWESFGSGSICLNPGSVSIPKAGSRHSYMILEGRQASWKDLAGDIYHTEML